MTKGAVAIIGCGTMGCDIAAIFLAQGWCVEAVAPDRTKWPTRLERVRKSLGQIDAELSHDRFELFAQADNVAWDRITLAIESVPEDFALKQAVFAELDQLAPSTVPIVTNASGLRISEIARTCQTRNRMAGLHFFLPAHLVPLVEVVRGEETDPDVCDRLYSIMEEVGHVPVRVNRDVPGFLANRIQHALMREAFAVIDAGLGTPEDVDAAVRYGFGFRYLAAGPILQKEMAGLDTQLAAARSIYPSLHAGHAPSRVLSELVRRGRLGVKAGRGFWDWTPESLAAEQERYEGMLLAAGKLLRRTNSSAMASRAGGENTHNVR